jgi:hypothetical protein
MMRFTGLAVVGLAAVGALAMLGSDRWVAAGYEGPPSRVVLAGAPVVGDEAYWLNTVRPRGMTPTSAAVAAPEGLETRTFEVGTRLTIAGATRLNLDIVATSALPAESRLLDAQGRPLILVTARERKGTRIVRFLVEADGVATTLGQKSL